MSKFVRQSKVRHVYCQAPKDEHIYKGIQLSTATGDHNYIKANTKYMAIPVAQGGGALAIFNMQRTDMRLGPGVVPVLDGHKGPVLDFDFNPFQQQLIATGGDDCTVKVWGIPPGGLTETQSEPLADLVGHDKKVTSVLHHPTAEFVLATGAGDKLVKVWDIEAQQEVTSTEHGEFLQGIDWSSTGELLASTSRDKQVRLIDPRTGNIIFGGEAHDGQRTAKCQFIPGFGTGNNPEALLTVGFTRQSKRQFKLWDTRQMGSGAYAVCNIDQAAGAILPFYDESTHMVYLAGKGDANIRFYEIVDGAPWQFIIDEFRTSVPCRGICMLPKRCVDTSICEVATFLKLCSDRVEPLRFICPRKSDLFQADLYPDCYAGKASIKAKDFFEGKQGKIIRMSMNPADKKDDSGAAAGKSDAVVITKKTLRQELDEALDRIATLEALLKKNNIQFN